MREPIPAVSVVVSIRGNGHRLPELLDDLTAQTLPASDMEAVLVDNDPLGRSTIPKTLTSTPRPFPVRIVREPQPGLSAGKNRGIIAARGQYVAFTDPDISLDADWARALLTAAQEEDVFAVGGRTTVTYPEGARFLSRPLAECHGGVEWPPGRAPALWPYWVTGCNLLFHRQRALDIGLLRTDLGRRGRWMGDCEDLEFIDRARQRGLDILIEPAAQAVHPVSRAETTLSYYLLQGLGHGVSLARMHSTVHVEPAAIRSGLSDVMDALGCLVGAWGFTSPTDAVVGLRDLLRIAAYRVESARMAATGARTLPTRSMTAPIKETS